jgi:hypothetical protein
MATREELTIQTHEFVTLWNQIQLTAPNNFKLKGTGVMEFHLGCDFFLRDTHVLDPKSTSKGWCTNTKHCLGRSHHTR